MSVGFTVAILAVPFFELLDREVKAVATAAFGSEQDADQAPGGAGAAGGGAAGALVPLAESRGLQSVMEASRVRLAQGIDNFVRSLPSVVRNDSASTRAAAYAVVGLADEKMLHYPSGGLEAWRDRLLEVDLYGSALAGQEVIRQAQESAQGVGVAGQAGSQALLAPLYLALLREGFEGSLRGDALGLAALTASLEETVGAVRGPPGDIAADAGPARKGFPPAPLAVTGFALWLVVGVLLWLTTGGDDLADADRIAGQVEAGRPAARTERTRTLGPSRLGPAEPEAATSRTGENSRSTGR